MDRIGKKAGVLALLGILAGLALAYLLWPVSNEKATPPSLAGDAMEQRAVDALVRRFDPAIRVYSANFTHIALDSSGVWPSLIRVLRLRRIR